MSDRKKQIWLRQDQVELTVMCLQHVKDRLNSDICNSPSHNMAGRFTYSRINEILRLLGDTEEK